MKSLLIRSRMWGLGLVLSLFLVSPVLAEDAPPQGKVDKPAATQKLTKKTKAKVTAKKVAPVNKDLKTKDVKPAEAPTNAGPSKGMQM